MPADTIPVDPSASAATGTSGVDAAPRHDAGRRFVPTLDGWRAIAVLLVICGHEAQAVRGFHSLKWAAAPMGAAGVKLFFAISGYLICTLLLIEASRVGRIALTAFYIRRAFRILPPALFYLLCLGALAAVGVRTSTPSHIFSAVFLLANYVHQDFLTNHFWSLSLEEHFYLMWPWALALAGAGGAMRLGIAACGATAIGRFAATGVWGADVLRSQTHYMADVFLVPCVMALALHASPRLRETLARRLRWPVGLLVVGLLLAAVEPLGPAAKRPLQALLFPLIVLATVLNPFARISRILEWTPLRFVGRISYSLYLWQQLFVADITRWLPLPTRMALLFGVATLSYYAIEQPLQRLGRRLASRYTTLRAERAL